MQMPSVFSNHHTATFDWRDRLRAAAIHLGLSAFVAFLAALLVFALWYPYPYREISGGRDLFLLVVCVDVVLGPLVTFAIFDRAKPRRELRRDLALVGLLQLAGLAYGLWTVNLARPVHMVFEYDRFRVVHLVDVPLELEDRSPPGIQVAPWAGPTLLSLRPFGSEQEKFDATMVALQGLPLAARPDFWQSYQAGRDQVLQAAKPVSQLKSRFPQRAAEIDAILGRAGREATGAAYLPLIARKAEGWTVLLDGTSAEVVGYLPLDSF
ncbi:MAG: pilus assembly protein [Comamonadaceae bacterium]|nr:MAG: pilus assembly protein [Comamonadaceae bacterium]